LEHPVQETRIEKYGFLQPSRIYPAHDSAADPNRPTSIN